MKRLSYIFVIIAALSLTSCHDWLTEKAPGSTDENDFLTSEAAAVQLANGVYVPLAWEWNTCYYGEWIFGDLCSDDAIKGGESIQDGGELYDLANFRTTSNNVAILDFYRAQFQGIARANKAIQMISAMPDELTSERMHARLLGEAKFLRAYYYFRLVRLFGGVPLVTVPIESSNDWIQPRATAEQIYDRIVSDLTDAESGLWNKSEYDASDLGRATKGAAQAMLLKVNLYRKDYDEAHKWGAKFMTEQSGEYDLQTRYLDNFAIEGENGIESIFEIQYVEEGTSDWGSDLPNGANGSTRGTLSSQWMRPRNQNIVIVGYDDKGNEIGQYGYGFNKPSKDLYDSFADGDPRRDYSIIVMSDAQIDSPAQEIQYGNRNISRKYLGFYSDNGKYDRYWNLGHATRSPINRREIRLADVLLLYAEACLKANLDLDKGAEALNRVRGRVGLDGVALTEDNIRSERRWELAMEGHRWFDLCRWGIVKQTMDTYRQKYTSANGAATTEGDDMMEFVEGKNELMPIPFEEVRNGKLTQNNGY